MNTLVFATCDITPAQWQDFAQTAGCPPDATRRDVYVPYILIHSLSQKSLERTTKIDATIKTQLTSATSWPDLKTAFLTLSSTSKNIISVDFLILDEQSFIDRTVVVVEKRREWVTPEGKVMEGWVQEGRDREVVVWRRGRCPFESAIGVQCGIEGVCGREGVERWVREEVEREGAGTEERGSSEDEAANS